MPTLGYTGTGNNGAPFNDGFYQLYGPFTASGGGAIAEFDCYFDLINGTGQTFVVAVYLDTSGGTTPVGATFVNKSVTANVPTSNGTLVSGIAVSGTAQNIVNASKYWIFLGSTSILPSVYIGWNTTGSDTSWSLSAGGSAQTPPATIPSGFTQGGNGNFSVYLKYGSNITLGANPSPPPNGDVGAGYSDTFTASGGTAPYSWSNTGTLPAGLSLTSLNASQGVLSGTPSNAATYNFTVIATDSTTATGSQAYAVTINAAVAITTTSLPNGGINQSYSQTIQATGGSSTYTFSLTSGTLPTGLTLATTGVLSGTPTAGGSFSFTVQATDTLGGTATQSYTVTISTIVLSPTVLPNGEVTVAYRQTITATGGVAPYTFSFTGNLPPGLTLTA